MLCSSYLAYNICVMEQGSLLLLKIVIMHAAEFMLIWNPEVCLVLVMLAAYNLYAFWIVINLSFASAFQLWLGRLDT